MAEEIKTFVNASEVLDNLRDNNMSTHEAICELIDNSLDHNAKNVWVDIGKDEDTRETWIIVQDDGDGVDRDSIKKALSLGGTFNPRYSQKIGRFGMGLSNACASQSPKSVFASKRKGQEKIWTNEIDFDYLKENEAIFPETYELKDDFILSKIKFEESGTIVYWKLCDNLDKKNHTALSNYLMDIFSRVYRHFLSSKRNIYLNDKKIEVFDPLCKLENHKFNKEYGIETNYGEEILIPIEYEDEEGNTITSNVIVELVLLDLFKIDKNPELRQKLKIGMRDQGLYLIRNGREINNPQWYNVQTQKIDHLNYLRGEIKFESHLDKFFGIGHNKSRAFPKDEVLDQLKKMVSPLVAGASAEHKRKAQQKKEVEEGGMELAKKIHKEGGEASIPEDKLTIEEIKAKKVEIKKKKPRSRKEIKDKLFRQIDGNPAISDDAKKLRKKRIEDLLEGKHRETIMFMNNGAGSPIFQLIHINGGKRAIMLNTDHKFYEMIYEPVSSNKASLLLLEVALYTIADVRDGLGDDNFVAIFDQIADRFSRRYGVMLSHPDVAAALAEAKRRDLD